MHECECADAPCTDIRAARPYATQDIVNSGFDVTPVGQCNGFAFRGSVLCHTTNMLAHRHTR